MQYEVIIFDLIVIAMFAPVGLYILFTYSLLALLRKEYPSKWEELGKPEFNRVSVKSTNAFLKFAWSKQAMSTLRQLWEI